MRQAAIASRAHRFADDLRDRRSTSAERAMCRLLDSAKISYVFQSPMYDTTIGTTFIADFRIKRTSLPKTDPSWHKQLFVEVDGGYHQNRQQYDQRRTAWMEAHRSAIVLRFSNDDVFTRPTDVLSEIERYKPARKTTRRSGTSRAR